MKRQGTRGATRARRKPRAHKRAAAGSRKAIEIVGLVEAISADFGAGDGVHLGQGIARLLAEVYKQRRGPTPAWVTQLVTHYIERAASRSTGAS